MRRFTRLPVFGLAVMMLLALASSVRAQNQYIGFVYPAGGQRGTTFPIRLGGQGLVDASDLIVSGEGVSVRLVDYYRVLDNQELGLLRQQLRELKKKETTVSDAMVAKMAWYEFPAPIGPITEPVKVAGVVCPICGDVNPPGATVCMKCNAKLEPAEPPKSDGKAPAKEPLDPEKEMAKQKMIERLERIFAEDERNPAVRSQTELVFAEVTVAPDAKPGPREIRVFTKRGISNALPFYVGQLPNVARRPMKTMQLPVLGKEHLAQRKRPPEEVEMRVTVPCTMNGQLAAGEINQYRFRATKGQRLVIAAKARALVPYVPDGVPGWFQAVLKLYDADGKEVAYNDDFRSDPDPVLCYEVAKDGDYVLTINEALFRGRESFTYRISVSELPFLTSIFPLGRRAGESVEVEMDGCNMEGSTLTPPPNDAKPGRHLVAATKGEFVSNYVPFDIDTLPECMDQEANDDPSKAQKVSLPVIVNGRMDHTGDWDVFEVEGKAGETIVAEVKARRLGSPFDSFIKVTGPDGKIIAINDDHYDAASGLNTDHADSYLMVKLPADGKYFFHIGDTRRQTGKAYAYRLRLSRPQPDFELRVVPSRIVLRSKASTALTIYAFRKDGFDGPITVSFKDLPEGVEAAEATVPEKKDVTRITVKTSLVGMEKPINVTLLGTAKVGDQEIVREAVPAEDRMQAFLWRHLLPAETLPLLVYDSSYKPAEDRIRPAIRDEDRPKDAGPPMTRSSVDWYLKRIERLYQEWLLTDEFINQQIASIEARLIQ